MAPCALAQRNSCSGPSLPQQKATMCGNLDQNRGGGRGGSTWSEYTQTFKAHFIFTSNSKSLLDDTCLLTGRGKTIILGRCSGFGQSLQLVWPIRQARQYVTQVCQAPQYLTGKRNPSGTQNNMETTVHIQRLNISIFYNWRYHTVKEHEGEAISVQRGRQVWDGQKYGKYSKCH